MNNKLLQPLKELYWTIPFLLFFTGYQLCNFLFRSKTVITPALLGKTVQEALPLLKAQELNVRLLQEKEDAHLPKGTIINQIPTAGQYSKPHQTVFIMTSKHPAPATTPPLTGLFYTEISKLLKNKKIDYKTVFLETNQPDKLCIAQIPEAGEPVPKEGVTIYCATQDNSLHIFPDLHNLPVDDVISFLHAYNIEPEIFHTYPISEQHNCNRCVIKAQKPAPGTCINFKKMPLVQLQA